MIDIAGIKDMVVGLLNAKPVEAGYLIYGMTVNDAAIDAAIEMGRRNLILLVGTSAFNLPDNEDTIESCLIEMSCHRTIINMMGISITAHFNYKTSDITVSKNVLPALENAEKSYKKNINQWLRILQSEHWTDVGVQTDLSFTDPIYIEEIGREHISMDSQFL